MAASNKPPKTLQSTPATIEVTDPVNTCCSSVMAQLVFTEITGTVPTRLTKIIGLNPDGTLRKETAANMSQGTTRRIEVNGLDELRDHLNGLTSANAVSWGITVDATTTLCTRSDAEAQEQGAIARTRDNFTFHRGPGIMMLDHDGLPNGSLTQDQFRTRLLAAAPALTHASMLGRPSASAGCLRPNGQVLTPLDRHRIYVPVKDASLIPEAGIALADLLWATPGDGWVDVGAAGQALMRCLVDTAVWQPERMDFAGPPELVDGVTRPLVTGVIYGPQEGQFDLHLLMASVTPAIRKVAEAARKAERAAAKLQCAVQAKAWAVERAPALAQARGIKLAQAINVLERASLHCVLMGDFELTYFDGSTITVAQLLDNPQRYHGTRYADPLDPNEDGRVAVARLLNGGRPDIYSHRHGGMRYELRRQSARVQIGRGMRIDSTDSTLRVLIDRSELFDYGDKSIAYVANRKAASVASDWLLDHLGRVVDFYSVRVNRDKEGHQTSIQEVAEDAPLSVATAILAKHGSRNFRRLEAVCTAPILRQDGSILDTPGHDEKTGLLYVTSEINPPTVPQSPTETAALDALALLWHPFRKFPVVDPVSVGVLISALIAAALRPSLPTCPAYGFDAPSAGTGKTLIAKCVAAMCTGGDVSVMPPAKDEDEWRKRLFAGLRGGDTVLLLDNVREPLGNAAIDSFITSPSFKDRILGESTTQELPNKALFLITGNNLMLTGDTHRRVLIVRLDAQQEQPFTREFAFNPQAEVIKNRQPMVVAALTIVRAYITAGRPKAAPGRIASFEVWDDLVRQPLCWLQSLVTASDRTDLPNFADPAESITRSESENPDQAKLAAMLNAWHTAFGAKPTTVAMAKSLSDPEPASVHLADAIDEIAGQNGKVNARILGRWIERHAEQRNGGLRFVKAGKAHGVMRWQVLQTVERAAGGLGGFGGISERATD
ncbi:MAG: hypothetical protein HHJ17_06615 [Rhodoferax sp.]|uniref:hypothetical protein n=1 Tax=Rhodoferax sp. TaxID=50421 RepID=UPI0017917706|nr:hypothetical protein [Rhodoferax sp.]NMM13196.1 hypothetical protein [Rhodoferax sp.]